MTGAQTICALCFTNSQRDGPFGSRIKYVGTQHGEAGKLSACPTGNCGQNPVEEKGAVSQFRGIFVLRRYKAQGPMQVAAFFPLSIVRLALFAELGSHLVA